MDVNLLLVFQISSEVFQLCTRFFIGLSGILVGWKRVWAGFYGVLVVFYRVGIGFMDVHRFQWLGFLLFSTRLFAVFKPGFLLSGFMGFCRLVTGFHSCFLPWLLPAVYQLFFIRFLSTWTRFDGGFLSACYQFIFRVFHRVFTGSGWLLTGFQRVSQSFTEFYRVLLGSIGFVPSFTCFFFSSDFSRFLLNRVWLWIFFNFKLARLPR